jgi:thioesterase domain-containing protein
VGWAGGEVLGYRDLVDRLSCDVPIHGLRAPGVDGDRLPLATIEEMAAYYVQEIRALQPHGPYLLGGYCFSGLVAYEMAVQLVAQGEQIGMLALIDAYYEGSSRRPSRLEIEQAKFKVFMDTGTRGKAAWVRRRAFGLKNRVTTRVYFTSGRMVYDALVATHSKRIPRGPWRLVLVVSSRARRIYIPRPAAVRIDFFRAQRQADDGPTPWEHLALDGVELRQVVVPDINHESMMHEPHVQRLADEVGRALNAAVGQLNAANGSVNGATSAIGTHNGAARDNGASNGGSAPLGVSRA